MRREVMRGGARWSKVCCDAWRYLCEPARAASNGEDDGEHVAWNANGGEHDARVEVDVGVELTGDEVLVLEGRGLEL
jgi:hypothetical protein